jgi:hypothetical protein
LIIAVTTVVWSATALVVGLLKKAEVVGVAELV